MDTRGTRGADDYFCRPCGLCGDEFKMFCCHLFMIDDVGFPAKIIEARTSFQWHSDDGSTSIISITSGFFVLWRSNT